MAGEAARDGQDQLQARSLWGAAFDATPKSVFAIVAWYLADCASDEGFGQGERSGASARNLKR